MIDKHERKIIIVIGVLLTLLIVSVSFLLRDRERRWQERRALTCSVIEQNPEAARVDDLVFREKYCTSSSTKQDCAFYERHCTFYKQYCVFYEACLKNQAEQ